MPGRRRDIQAKEQAKKRANRNKVIMNKCLFLPEEQGFETTFQRGEVQTTNLPTSTIQCDEFMHRIM